MAMPLSALRKGKAWQNGLALVEGMVMKLLKPILRCQWSPWGQVQEMPTVFFFRKVMNSKLSAH